MELRIYQIDAFTDSVFSGNPAAVVPLDYWLDEDILQSIANENNLSETAFFVPNNNEFDIRWFTPESEVELCGHATLASAFVIFTYLDIKKHEIVFQTRFNAKLIVRRDSNGISMDFPIYKFGQCNPPQELLDGLGVKPKEVFKGPDYLVIYDTEEEILSLKPDYSRLKLIPGRGVIVTAKAKKSREADFVSRFFCPKLGVPEDPVCGSAHCMLAPFWSKQLGKAELIAHQVSMRGGVIYCNIKDDRVELKGNAVNFMEGNITF